MARIDEKRIPVERMYAFTPPPPRRCAILAAQTAQREWCAPEVTGEKAPLRIDAPTVAVAGDSCDFITLLD